MSTALVTANRDQLAALLEHAKPKLAEVLPKHLTPERIVRLSLAQTSKNQELAKCEPRSILYSVLVAASLGLEPDGVLGSAWLAPFGGQC